jgi:MerT mercuric transport protein
VTVDTVKSASDKTGSGALVIGGLAAILASTCCLGPLVLVALGLRGAWIGNLTLLEPYRPVFIAGALVALFFGEGVASFGPHRHVSRVKSAQCHGLAAFSEFYS